MKLLVPALCLLLLACSQSGGIGNDDAMFNSEEAATPLAPGTRPVRIGEGGASFAACSGVGRVVNIAPSGETYLPVRAAPFAEALEVARLGEGARVFVCTRSIDQRWQGVVAPPAGAPGIDCGVGVAVAAPANYAGPCKSGWVSSAFIRLTAD